MVPINQARFEKDGYAVLDFPKPRRIRDLQSYISTQFPLGVETWAASDLNFDQYVNFMDQLTDRVAACGLVTELVRDNIAIFEPLFGPDIDVQSRPHVRVSRPEVKADVIAIHRDTFYGSSPYELNLWIPIFALPEGAGLRVVPGSHVLAPKQVTDVVQDVPVTKGSAANRMGYLYAPKTDEVISGLKPEDMVLTRPEVGQATLFFSSTIHVGQGSHEGVRVSIDVRLRSPFTPTSTKQGYYIPLARGILDRCARQYLAD